MNLFKCAIAVSMAISLVNVVYAGKDKASGAPMYQVPFYNVVVEDKILADYSFDTHSQTLVCKKVSGDVIETIGWEYKGVRYKAQLPLELKDDEAFNGQWADPEGKLTIVNASHYDRFVVTCEYSHKK